MKKNTILHRKPQNDSVKIFCMTSGTDKSYAWEFQNNALWDMPTL